MTRQSSLPAMLLGAALAAAPGGWAADRVEARSADAQPEWVSRPPEPSRGQLSVVGIKTGALSLEEGREAAWQDAARKIQLQIRSRISARTLVRRTAAENRILDRILVDSGGRLEGMREDQVYWEKRREKGRDGSSAVWDVWVLAQYPLAEMEHERSRLDNADAELISGLDAICEKAAALAPLRRTGVRVLVADFQETTTQSRFALSRVLEEHLRTCLSQRKLRLAQSGKADCRLTGGYWQSGEKVLVSLRLLGAADGEILGSAQASLPLDAVEPLWMQDEDDAEAGFFAAPGRPTAAPRPPRGAIMVRSDPPGARIYIDGQDRGQTPSEIMGLEPGNRSVDVSLGDHVPVTRQVLLEAGGKAVVKVRLERETGGLRIRSDPVGAEVSIDGKLSGHTPYEDPRLPTGRYEISLRKDRYQPWEQAVEVEYGKETEVSSTLTEEDGAISILVRPSGADILIDGRIVGQSGEDRPLVIKPVAAGQHEVSARKDGCRPEEWSVRVRAFETASVSGSLRRRADEPRPERFAHKHREPWRMPELPSFHRPESMVYFNALGGAVAGHYYNVRLLEGAVYLWGSAVGLGSSLLYGLGGDYSVTHTTTKYNYGRLERIQEPSSVSMTSVFPLQVYFVPWVHTYSALNKKTAASIQAYCTMSWWVVPQIDTGNGQTNGNGMSPPTSSLLDYGIMLHTGLALGVRAGISQVKMRDFDHYGTHYSALNEKRAYVAVDLSLGGFMADPGK